jgi:DNA-binding CsgD family transcriptional regulator
LSTLATAVKASCAGSAIFSEEAWRQLGRSLGLSRRELQSVRGIFDDRKESTIANELGISAHTVHTHMERLRRKLGVVDRVELVLRIVNEFLRLTTVPDGSLPPLCATRAAGRCPFQRRQTAESASRKVHL